MLNLRSSNILRAVNKDIVKIASVSKFSSNGEDSKSKIVKEKISIPAASDEDAAWNRIVNWELLGLTAYRFCLPGNVGIAGFTTDTPRKPLKTSSYRKVVRPKKVPSTSVVKLPDTMYMRHMDIVAQLSALASEIPYSDKVSRKFKCSAVNCPKLLKEQVSALFSQTKLENSAMTAVCIALRYLPRNIEKDWQSIINLFEETARRICVKLTKSGFWADYPTNVALPADPTSAAQIEAALNLSSPGLKIINQSGCLLLMHAPFGKSKIIGWLFTTAPYLDTELLKILAEENV